MDADGEGEIVNLARRILDLTEDGRGEGEAGSHFQAGAPPPGVGASGQGQGQQQQQNGGQGQGDDHAALRASVHQALRSSR